MFVDSEALETVDLPASPTEMHFVQIDTTSTCDRDRHRA